MVVPYLQDDDDVESGGSELPPVAAETPDEPEVQDYAAPVDDVEPAEDRVAQAEPPFVVDTAPVEAVSDEPPRYEDAPVSAEEVPAAPLFAEAEARPKTRIEDLTEAIQMYPNSPTNYILRAELLFDKEDYKAAADDFYVGLRLALSAVEHAEWGYIYEALIERAYACLKRC